MSEIYFEKTTRTYLGVYWYKNKKNTTKIEPHLKSLYHCIENKGENFVIYSSDGFNLKWCIASYQEILKMIEKDNHIYEVLTENVKRKVYFDIDFKPLKTDTFNEFVEKSKKIILTMFPQAIFNISGSESVEKWSIHVILSNYYTSNLKDSLVLKCFCDTYKDYGFDSCVYSKNRNMKCINQSKGYKIGKDENGKQISIKDTRIQAIIEGSKHLILHDFDDNAININTLDFGDYLMINKEPNQEPKKLRERLKNKEKGIDILNIQPSEIPLSLEFDYYNATNLEKLKELHNPNLNHMICIRVMWWCKNNDISFEDFWEWNSKKENSIERKMKYLADWNRYCYNVDRKFVDHILEQFYPHIRDNWAYQRYIDYTNIDTLITTQLKGYLTKENINPDIKTTILGVGCGRNKTGSMIDYTKIYPNKKVLVIVPRITLAYDIEGRFKKEGLNITNYKNEKEYLGFTDKLIISTSSLYKLQQFDFDIVVCDEFETLIDQFLTGDIHGKGENNHLESNWIIFKDILINSKKVILMDAITTKKTITFIDKLNIAPYEFVNNKRENIREIIRVKPFRNKDGYIEKNIEVERRFFNMILNSLKKGKKVFVFMPYKEGRKEKSKDSKHCIRGVIPLANYIMKKLGFNSDDVKGYYAEARKVKQELINVNDAWKNAKCIITNTCNSVGINYELDDFDEIYAFYAPWVNPRDFIQVVYRIRNPISKEIVIYSEPKRSCKIEQFEYKKIGCPIQDVLIKNDILERSCYSLNSLYYLCERNGIKVKSNGLSKDDLKDLETLIIFDESDDYRITYDSISDIDSKTLQELYNKYEGGYITLYEKYQIEKYNFQLDNHLEKMENFEIKLYWMFREYISKFQILNDNPNHLINRFLKGNGINIFSRQTDKFPINGHVPYEINVKDIQFLEKFKYKDIIKNYGQGTYVKIINAYFGKVMNIVIVDKNISYVTKNKKKYIDYSTSVHFIDELKMYKKYNRKYNLIKECRIVDSESECDIESESESESENESECENLSEYENESINEFD